MLLDFYNLREQPFGVTPDPRFLFLGDSHREALASLFCSIDADRGFMALIAHPGMGKTTLAFQLLEKLRQSSRTIFLFQTQCNSRELFQYILNDLGVDCGDMDIVSMHNKLNDVLCVERRRGRRVILVIDEAQNLDPAVLETIRLLSNFETPSVKLLQIVLIGQPQLSRTLNSPALLQLEQRITTLARIDRFNPPDTERYIDHRLQIAGYAGEQLFTGEALALIAERSQGIPRNINTLCFNALSLGCAMQRKNIDASIVREVLADLNLQSVEGHEANPMPVPQPTVERVLFRTQKNDSRWFAIASIGLAACGLLGMILAHSNVMRHFRQAVSDIAASYNVNSRSIKKTAAATEPTLAGHDDNSDTHLIGNRETDAAAAASRASDNSKTIEVTVQHGETLRQITLRTFGKYNPRLIAEIQSLNAEITNPNRIEANQEIRLPQPSKPSIFASVPETSNISDKN